MDLQNIIQVGGYILFIIVLVLVIYFKYKSAKKTDKDIDLSDYLSGIAEKALDLCKHHIDVMTIKRSDYTTIEEYKTALCKYLALEIKEWTVLILGESQIALQNLLTVDVIKTFLSSLISVEYLQEELTTLETNKVQAEETTTTTITPEGETPVVTSEEDNIKSPDNVTFGD